MNRLINELIAYAFKKRLINESDREYVQNALIYLLRLDHFETEAVDLETVDFFVIMKQILDAAVKEGIIEDSLTSRDNLEAKLMDVFLPKPSELDQRFYSLYKKTPKAATDFFFKLSQDTNYIKTKRIAKNISFVYRGKYGLLQLTINLSKPEKDPQAIAESRGKEEKDYPKCALCMENVGFYGTETFAPRSNHRVISLTLNHEKDAWGFQYSPYQYFNEHSIVLKKQHIPMRVDHQTFDELVDFVDKFPHYLMGSNAGLPIVGGSILSHYHFQGGRHEFPIEKARVLKCYQRGQIKVEALDWPVSTIRVSGKNKNAVLSMVKQVFDKWLSYDNPELDIIHKTTEHHNAMTPILKLDGADYNFYLVLRNNRSTIKRPFGLFHPREELFHIKKENIGLIEVMGLAILPGRLKQELDLIKRCFSEDADPKAMLELEKHLSWIDDISQGAMEARDIDRYLEIEVGKVFEAVLEDCGVFKTKDKEAFLSFVETAIN
ncbi:MAG: galactose-1-phosphate uridylyltransferase [Candidatus Izemoplasmatales bacterium]|jgi:UDPglucose--hexose-1-phosphate uridylyltransferase